jgi:hypothetical protein
MDHKVVELDVREDIKNKLDPFVKIMNTIRDLQENDQFILHAPFKPLPLYQVMKGKGFVYETEEIDRNHYKVTFTKKA